MKNLLPRFPPWIPFSIFTRFLHTYEKILELNNVHELTKKEKHIL